MKVTDQPGRVFALVILCPGIIFMAYKLYIDEISRENVAKILLVFSIVFFFYELFWVIFYKPKKINFPPKTTNKSKITSKSREKRKENVKSAITQEEIELLEEEEKEEEEKEEL